MNFINHQFISDIINEGDPYAWGHAAEGSYLGLGMLYYTLAYILKVELCVCLGSGRGFVPKLMRQAQIDSGIGDKSRTVLIDSGINNKCDYIKLHSYFDVVIVKEDTKAVARKKSFNNIGYLHIDADHKYDMVRDDFYGYLPLMLPQFIITLHDIREQGVDKLLYELRVSERYSISIFPPAAGVAVISSKKFDFPKLF